MNDWCLVDASVQIKMQEIALVVMCYSEVDCISQSQICGSRSGFIVSVLTSKEKYHEGFAST